MINILIVGLGSIGRTHLENLRQFKNVKIIVCTKRTDLNSFIEQGVKVSDSLTECLKENIDVAIISNETSLHIQTAIKLAERGLDLFIEKPLDENNEMLVEKEVTYTLYKDGQFYIIENVPEINISSSFIRKLIKED